eukprot:scaffold7384_cov236-Pinguiococcus_pyrenoidosus.AAC.5
MIKIITENYRIHFQFSEANNVESQKRWVLCWRVELANTRVAQALGDEWALSHHGIPEIGHAGASCHVCVMSLLQLSSFQSQRIIEDSGEKPSLAP